MRYKLQLENVEITIATKSTAQCINFHFYITDRKVSWTSTELPAYQTDASSISYNSIKLPQHGIIKIHPKCKDKFNQYKNKMSEHSLYH